MKRVLLVVLSLMVLASLVWAGGKQEKEAASTGKIKLRAYLLYFDEARKLIAEKYYKPWLAERLPNLDVTWELGQNDQTSYIAQLQTYLAAGDMPDEWITMGYAQSIPLLKAGALAKLDEYFAKDGYNKKFTPVLRDAYTARDGHMYAINNGSDAYCAIAIYGNKDMFSAAGLAIPKTWDEFTHAIEVFKGNGITPMLLNGKDDWEMVALLQMLTWVEDKKATENLVNGKIKIDDPVYLNAFTRAKQLAEMGAFQKGFLNDDYLTCLENFKAGKAPMMFAVTWSLYALFADISGNAGPLQKFIVLIPFPSTKGEDLSGVRVVHADAMLGHSVYAKSKNVEWAVKLLEMMNDADATYGVTRGYPVALDVGVELDKSKMSPFILDYIDSFGKAPYKYGELYNNFTADIIASFFMNTQAVMAGTKTPQGAIADINKAMSSK
jgi:ABC-type glycerol-3-phosphate transport system substrate-binding protein